MPITGLSFLLFALAAVVLYYLFPKRLRQYVLLAASILFYLTYGVRMAGYLAATILLTYLFGLWLDRLAAFRPAAETKEERKRQKRANDRKKRRVLALSLVLNFASLALLKYGGFLAAAVNSVLGTELPLPLREQIEQYDNAALNAFYQALSDVTDYWNFSITPLTYDERFFYDVTHTRNAAADLVVARIAGDESVGLPDAFGAYCRQGESTDAAQLKKAAGESAYLQNGSATVPILLYHHLDPDQPESETTLHPETFERQMRLLKEQGYTPISFDELIAFVEQGTPLPEKPVMITFDDGYASNAVYAYPVLRELGFHASIFAIGCSIGHDRYYKDTNYSLTPHFGQTEITEMLDSGLISIGSHTYDMHQWPPYETVKPARENMLPLPGESETDYIHAVQTDAAREAETFAAFGIPAPDVLAFPEGAHTTLTDVVLRECGYKVTLTTDESRVNTVVVGLPQTLIDLGRMTVLPGMTDEQLLQYLNERAN